MKKFLCFLLAAFLLIGSPGLSPFAHGADPSYLAETEKKGPIYSVPLDSQGVFVYNLETGTVIYEKAQDSRMFPASTTKIMTALVALDLCLDPKNTTVTTPSTDLFYYIIREGGVNMNLAKGEVFTVYDLLLGLMMNSYCDAADLLAYHFGDGSVSAFVEKMNQKAADLKLENTHFENAHGLHSPNHYSSPRDIAKILAEAAKNPIFREIISTREYSIPATAYRGARKLRYTVNIYYPDNSYYLDCFVGGKSGFTNQAGRCLATLSEKDGVSYISVLLGANSEAGKKYSDNMSWVETNMLLSYAHENYLLQTVVEKDLEVGLIPVTDSETVLSVKTGDEIRILVRNGTKTEYRTELLGEIPLERVQNEAVVGKATLLLNGEATEITVPLLLIWDGTEIIVKTPLEIQTENAVEAVSGIFKTDRIFLGLIILLLILIALCIPAMKISRFLNQRKHRRPKH